MLIGKKLVLGFLCITVVVFFIGLVGYYNAQVIHSTVDEITLETAPEIIILGKIDALSQEILSETVSYVLLHDNDDNVDEAEYELQELKDANIEMNNLFEEFKKNSNVDSIRFTDMENAKNRLQEVSEKLIQSAINDEGLETIIDLKNEFEVAETEFENSVDKYMEFEEQRLDFHFEESKSVVETSMNYMILSIIISVTASFVFGFILAKSISKSLTVLKNATVEIAKGNFKQGKLKINGSDEISSLGSDIQKMATELELQRKKLVSSERLSAMGELSQRIAHDLRSPISIIQNSVSVLEQNSKNEKNKEVSTDECILVIKDEIEKMSMMIKQTMNFGKAVSIKPQKTSFPKMLDSILKNIDIPKNIQVDRNSLENNDSEIFCDFGQMTIVFQNLIENAIESIGTKTNGIISFSSEMSDDATTLKISDNGKGISQEDLPMIFEPLFTTKSLGFGLGLLNSKIIVEQHSGKIKVYSTPEKTTFTIILPRK